MIFASKFLTCRFFQINTKFILPAVASHEHAPHRRCFRNSQSPRGQVTNGSRKRKQSIHTKEEAGYRSRKWKQVVHQRRRAGSESESKSHHRNGITVVGQKRELWVPGGSVPRRQLGEEDGVLDQGRRSRAEGGQGQRAVKGRGRSVCVCEDVYLHQRRCRFPFILSSTSRTSTSKSMNGNEKS